MRIVFLCPQLAEDPNTFSGFFYREHSYTGQRFYCLALERGERGKKCVSSQNNLVFFAAFSWAFFVFLGLPGTGARREVRLKGILVLLFWACCKSCNASVMECFRRIVAPFQEFRMADALFCLDPIPAHSEPLLFQTVTPRRSPRQVPHKMLNSGC